MTTNLSCPADSSQWQITTGLGGIAAGHKVNLPLCCGYGKSINGWLPAILMAEIRKQLRRVTEFQ